MATSFVIQSVHGAARLELLGDVPSGLTGYEGFTFTARLAGPPIDATVEVYDVQPQHWSEFFRGLAENWRGWSGEVTHESLEGHLCLACTCDRTGHVRMRVTLRGMFAEDDWLAQVELQVEAGQLGNLARAATEFFPNE